MADSHLKNEGQGLNEDIIRMAKQAGGRESGSPELYDCFIMSLDDLKRFADLVAAAERERIKAANAPVIENINKHLDEMRAAIRARSKE